MRAAVGFFLGLAAGAFLVVTVGTRWMPRDGSRAPAAIATPVPVATRPPSLEGRRAPAAGHEFVLVARMADQSRRGRAPTDAGTWETILLVDNGAVRTLALPETVDRAVLPVTDGERLYAYVRAERGRGARLVAFSFDGREEETITDATPLVEPRDLFVSPDGLFLAFFLDNRTSQSTELWTYDTSARAKRVSVERLERPNVFGPFFAPDGSFLLSADDRVLAGSPRRTGVDILDVPAAGAAVVWEAGIARAPGGDRVAFVVDAGDAATRVQRVLESRLGSTATRPRFSVTQAVLQLLGWREPDTLLVLSRPVQSGRETPPGGSTSRSDASRSASTPTLWVVRSGDRISRDLGAETSSFALAPDGQSAVLLRGAAGNRLDVLDLLNGQSRTVGTLPLEAPVAATSPSPAVSPTFRVVQFLRRGGPPATESSTPGSLALSPEVTLQTISDHAREISDPPPDEPVTVERVWFTQTANTVYVDYRVGTTLWRRLVRVAQTSEGASVEIVGVFAPIQGEWVLTRGSDVADSTPTALYEYDLALRAWVEKPVAAGAQP